MLINHCHRAVSFNICSVVNVWWYVGERQQEGGRYWNECEICR